MTIEKFWKEYQQIDNKALSYEAWSFGGTTSDMPNHLADLVATGVKTATSSAYDFYLLDNSPLPQVGSYHIILDTKSAPICIIKITQVYTTTFNKVTKDHAFKEGEGDRSLKYWRAVHKEFFTDEFAKLGKEFTEDIQVVCEEFQLVYPL